MKNFLRSVAGKTVLFVLVIIMFVTAAVSAFSVALLAVYGFYDEKTDIESAKRRMEKEYFISYVQSDAYSAAFSVIRDGEEPYTPDSLDYAFYDETGKQLSTNYDAAVSANDDIWSYRVYIWKNETFFRTLFTMTLTKWAKSIFSAQIPQICARDISALTAIREPPT